MRWMVAEFFIPPLFLNVFRISLKMQALREVVATKLVRGHLQKR